MTIAHLDLLLHPEPHGFHAAVNRAGHAVVVKGRDADHATRLAGYQRQIRLAGLDWIEEHDGRWPHFEDPIFLGVAFWLHRPTTYRVREMWHRTARPDRTTLVRAVEDALIRVFYYDDGQVADGRAAKLVTSRALPERVELWVAPASQAADVLRFMAYALPDSTPPGGGRGGRPPGGPPGPPGTLGPSGQPEDPARLLPVLSDARSQTSGRSIPGQSSPPSETPLRLVVAPPEGR